MYTLALFHLHSVLPISTLSFHSLLTISLPSFPSPPIPVLPFSCSLYFYLLYFLQFMSYFLSPPSNPFFPVHFMPSIFSSHPLFLSTHRLFFSIWFCLFFLFLMSSFLSFPAFPPLFLPDFRLTPSLSPNISLPPLRSPPPPSVPCTCSTSR